MFSTRIKALGVLVALGWFGLVVFALTEGGEHLHWRMFLLGLTACIVGAGWVGFLLIAERMVAQVRMESAAEQAVPTPSTMPSPRAPEDGDDNGDTVPIGRPWDQPTMLLAAVPPASSAPRYVGRTPVPEMDHVYDPAVPRSRRRRRRPRREGESEATTEGGTVTVLDLAAPPAQLPATMDDTSLRAYMTGKAEGIQEGYERAREELGE